MGVNFMKCGKCGEEVIVQPGKSINFCSNCGNKIEGEKTSGWKYFDNTKELLQYVAAEYGSDALFGRKHFSDHSSPMMPQGQKNLVKLAFECGAVKVLQDNVSADQAHKEIAVKQAVGKLVDTYASAKEAAEGVIWEFTNALGWGMAESQDPSKQQSTTTIESAMSQSNSRTESFMKRAWLFLEDSEWKRAYDYFNNVLDMDAEYSPAYIGLLCVDLKLKHVDELADLNGVDIINNNSNYKKAVRYADANIRSKLDGYLKTIKDRLEAEQKAAVAEAERKRKAAEEAVRKKRVQDAFDSACVIMNNAQSSDEYRKAITAFGSIDSNYKDINSQIKSKIDECEQKIAVIKEEFRNKYGVLFDRLSAQGRAEAQAKAEQRWKSAQVQLDTENKKVQAEVEAKCAQIRQRFNSDHEAWQDECNSLKASYDTECMNWEAEINAFQAQMEQWKLKGLCPHCGGVLKGLFTKKCCNCDKLPIEPIKAPTAPIKPIYPTEPQMPQMPTYTPRKLEVEVDPLADVEATIKGELVFVKLGGIDWRVLSIENNKALLISEIIIEEQMYDIGFKDVTWENCSIREYLNGEFYNKLGTAKSAVLETSNWSYSPFYESDHTTTTDKVFLLDVHDVVRYFGDGGIFLWDIERYSKENSKFILKSDGKYLHDQYDTARIASDETGRATWWWLRSPGESIYHPFKVLKRGGFIKAHYKYKAAVVDFDGSVDIGGCTVNYSGVGVRPALWLNLL